MITQIYTAQTPAEALALADLGVDHVGVTVSDRGLPGEVSLQVGKDMLNEIGDTEAKSIALTVETDPRSVRELIDNLRPDIVHLCGDTSRFGPQAVGDIRDWLSHTDIEIELMQAIAMVGPESIGLAMEFEPYVDWLILDSVSDDVEGIGAAGFPHDWKLSRQIVEAVAVPVILAGGLGPDNVADAIDAVRPAGVDSLTKTNRFNQDGTFSKDLDAVERFLEAVRSSRS